jgi:rhodanese-related sulfurtransferase
MRWIEAMREEPGERKLGRIALQAALLVAVPGLAAVAVDLVRPDGLPLVSDTDYRNEILVPCPENVKEAKPVELSALPADLAGFTVVDARTSGEFLAGRIPGAISIPHRALHTADPRFKAALAEDLAPLRGIAGAKILVCGDERTGSGRDFASVLLEHGFDGVRHLAGGCAAWTAAGREFERPLTGALAAAVADVPADLGGLTIIDGRFSKNWRRGHLPGAISIPYRMLQGPGDEKLAPLRGAVGGAILVYGSAARGEGKDLAEVLAANGFPGVRYLDGGFEAWEAAGKPVEGAAAEGGEGASPAADASGQVADSGGAP